MSNPYPKPPKKPKKAKRWITKPVPAKNRRKELFSLLDTLTSHIVILRDGGCVTPDHCSGKLTCSHYYPRDRKKTRFSLVNCNCQCSTHNNRHNHYPNFYEVYMLKHYSQAELLQNAQDASINSYKWSIPDLEALAEDYQAVYNELMAESMTKTGVPISPEPLK